MNVEEQMIALMKRVENLEAIEKVRDVIAKYSWAVDTQNWGLLEAILTDDAVVQSKWRDIDYVGKQAVVTFFQQHRKTFKFTNRMSNLNELITIDENTAKATSYCLVMYTVNGESRIGWGTYGWHLRREDGFWRMDKLVIRIELMTTLEKGWGMESDRILPPPPLGEDK
jgi:ketosteroid isomerase-like protein